MSRRSHHRIGSLSLACLGLFALPACTGVCGDDGWVWNQQDNPACNAQNDSTAGESETDAQTTTNDPTDDPTDNPSASDTDEPTAGSATMGGGVNCKDNDGDGFGDPEMCMDQPFPGSVPNNEDCADDNKDAFPGSAENDSTTACMEDADGDGYGDDMPPEGVDPGTDCDDDNVGTFPGAAENDDPMACMQDADGDGFGDSTPSDPEVPPGTDCDDDDEFTFPGAAPNDSPDACMKDEDGDDWGDLMPPDGVEPGSDCLDTNPDTFPGAAPNDSPEACMKDDDGDDYGDDMPPGGVTPGSDCNDAAARVHVDCTDCTPNEVVCNGDVLETCNAEGTNSDKLPCEFGCDDVGKQCWQQMEVDAGPTVCIEFGASTQLQATVMGGDGNYTYDWTPIDSLDDPKIADPLASPTGPTSYDVAVSDGEGNMGSDSVTVYINNLPLQLDPEICDTYDFPWSVDVPTIWDWNDQKKELCQTVNGKNSALFCGWDLSDATVKGTFRVNKLDNDDDYVGFMWGIQNTDQFYIFTWKRLAQDFGGACGNVPQGMMVKMVDVADPMMNPQNCADLHAPNDTPNSKLLLAPADISTAGWAFNTDYLFELTHKQTGEMNIVVRNKADNAIIAQKAFMDTTYPSGKFGQYTYSQIGACFSDYKTTCIE